MAILTSFTVTCNIIAIFLSAHYELLPFNFLPYLTALLLVYAIYDYKCSEFFYKYIPPNKGISHRGTPPPSFPNGWYVICRSSELSPLSAKSVNQSGYNIVLFRGADKIAYALDAFCPHSGANLGVGGQVKYQSCIQCPFHGWLFDGRTGNLVTGEGLAPKKVTFFEYNEQIDKCSLSAENYLKKTGEGFIKNRKYLIKEMNGFIHVWLHSDENAEPTYEPLDISDIQSRLQFRGTSMNRVFCHCQDIVENGSDIRHFIYVHAYLIPFSKVVKAEWTNKWCRADDPQFREKMKHKIDFVNQYKEQLFDKYINKSNASSIGVMSLEMNIIIFNSRPIFFFNATVFQVGPGLVYLFLINQRYETVFFEFTKANAKFEQDVYHDLYTSWYLPYWYTALILRMEAEQVTNDTHVWNNKLFASSPKYNVGSEADDTILEFRRWFAQFYEGCKLREAEQEKYTW